MTTLRDHWFMAMLGLISYIFVDIGKSHVRESIWIRKRAPNIMNRDKGPTFLAIFDPLLTSSSTFSRTPPIGRRQRKKLGQQFCHDFLIFVSLMFIDEKCSCFTDLTKYEKVEIHHLEYVFIQTFHSKSSYLLQLIIFIPLCITMISTKMITRHSTLFN